MNRIPANRYVVFALLAVLGLGWDLASKAAVFADLGYPGGVLRPDTRGNHAIFACPQGIDGESVPYLDGWLTFRLLTSFNRGALWGVGQRFTWVFSALSLIAVLGIPFWLFGRSAARSLWLTVALAFILAGTLGNLYDRLGCHRCADADGVPIRAVRDFLLFTFGPFHWPVFNFADVFLVTGAIMLVVPSLVPARSPSPDAPQTSPAPPLENTSARAVGVLTEPRQR